MLAQAAARIIAAEGVRGYQQAKHKARERLGNSHYRSLPSNVEIEKAISSFHKIFLPDHAAILNELRCNALIVMGWLQDFSPYLVGEVLTGTANANTPVSIHVSCDTIETVIEVLQQQGLETRIEDRRFRLQGETVFLPTLIFSYGDCEINVTIFTLRQQHQRPKSKSQNRSMQRINMKSLQHLIRQTSDRPDSSP